MVTAIYGIWRTSMPLKPSTPKDKFGDDMMIKAETTPQGADRVARIIAISRGIRHVLTPIAWVICTGLVVYATVHITWGAG
ncbi:hypothetical protein CB343_005205 [Salmonella enterica subsp. diarizonae]|nr:hypothetical protein [Salmonella enterica subsp. diarizonae]